MAMGSDADGFIKASSQMNEAWLAGLVEANVIDQASSDRLRSKRYSLLAIRAEDLKIPDAWIKEDVDIAERMVSAFRQRIRGGLTAEDLGALTRTLTALYAFVDVWFDNGHLTANLEDEEALQRKLRDCLTMRNLSIQEGTLASGGKFDLFVENAILIENKFYLTSLDPKSAAPSAACKGAATQSPLAPRWLLFY